MKKIIWLLALALSLGTATPKVTASDYGIGIGIPLPSTGGNWKALAITLENPPKRNLVKLDFRTRGGPIDIEWLKIP